MPKIIALSDDGTVSIGTDDGGIRETRCENIMFEPHIGDQVELFENGDKLIVHKANDFAAQSPMAATPVAPAPVVNVSTVPAAGDYNFRVGTIQGEKPAPYVPEAPKQKVVNKVGYVLLALLLGGFGAHKFYSGKTGLGILYIVFCWTFIPATVALVEAIIALTKKADVNGNIVV